MPSPWKFIKAHPLFAVSVVLGAALNLYGTASTAYDLYTAGLHPWAWQAIGAGLFFLSCVTLLYSFWAAHPNAPEKAAAEKRLAVAPERPWNKPRINYAAWDNIDLFQINAAAQLWAENEPAAYMVPWTQDSVVFKQMLSRAADTGKLRTATSAGQLRPVRSPVREDTHVTRQQLLDYAAEINQKPTFLFPGERKAEIAAATGRPCSPQLHGDTPCSGRCPSTARDAPEGSPCRTGGRCFE